MKFVINPLPSLFTSTRYVATSIVLLAVFHWSVSFAAEAEAGDKVTLKVVKVDSEETSGEDGKGANAVDGDTGTIWHTQWQDANPTHPHEIVIQLSRACKIKGFTYLPRQDDSDHGNIKDYELYVSEDGKDFGLPVKRGMFEAGKEKQTVSFEPNTCRFIRIRALSEINGEAWTSAAEIGIVQAGDNEPVVPTLKVVKADSEETAGEDGKAANAVDGDPVTFWHTQWQDSNPPHPHEITIELTPPTSIRGFTYLPRQGDIVNGTIKDYEFYVSNDGKDFGTAVKKGAFESGSDKKTVMFSAQKCRFIKLKALSEVNGEAWTSAAEIGVVVGEK